MQSKASTVAEYLASLPPDRRAALEAVRSVIRKNLDKGYEEGMQYGMIGYYVPHSLYPAGYHCDPKQPLPCVGLASQKNYMALYLFSIYMSPMHQKRFVDDWRASGKRLDMGKSCVRFKSLDDVPLDVVGRAIRDTPAKAFIASYEAGLAMSGIRRSGASAATSAKASPRAAKTSTPGAAKKSAKKSATMSAKKTVKKTAKKAAKKTSGRVAKKASRAR